MLRTILTIAACSLIITLANSQSKVGSNVLIIDPASMFEVESDSSGILPPRLTTAQRDAQTEWDEGHIIYNSTDHCLQVFNGTDWDCFVQGVQIDSTIYRYNGTLSSDRIVGMGGFQLTFDGSGDVVITDAGFVGIGDPTPEAKLDVEGGTVRLSDYGSGINTGSESYLLGVDSDGDVIEVTPAIDTFSLIGDELRLSVKGDQLSYDSVDLSKYLDDINVYEDEGTLTGNRTMSLNGNWFRMSGTDSGANIQYQDDSDIRQFGPGVLHQMVDTSGNELRLFAGSTAYISAMSDFNLTLRQNNENTIGLLSNDYLRFYDYGDGLRTGTPTYILGVDADGDVLDVDASTLGSDDQVLDSLGLTGSTLEVGIENDANGLQTLDLSSLDVNIYNTSDTLEGNRTVELDGSDLTFGATSDVTIKPSGYVGIGDPNPSSELEVNGLITGGFGARTTGGTLDWDDASNARSGNGNTLLLGTHANGPGMGAYFHPFTFEYNTKTGGGNMNQLAIPYNVTGQNAGMYMRTRYTGVWQPWTRIISEHTNGNVGIGTISPSETLDVAGNMKLDSAFIDKDGDPGTSGQLLSSTVSGTDWIDQSTVGSDNQILDSLGLTGTTLEIGIENDANGLQTLDLSSLLHKGTTGSVFFANAIDGSPTEDNSNLFWDDTNNRLGIGTASPSTDLHLSGGTGSVELLLEADTDNNGELNQPRITFIQDGGIVRGHIGLTEGTNNVRIANEFVNAASDIDFQTSGSTRLTIEGSGNVGIGTNAPDELLHVAGDMRLDGAFEDKDGEAGTLGQVLTSTAIGTDWVNSSSVGTDDQIIDSLGLDGNTLNIGIEGDINGLQSVDLSSITGTSDNIYNTSDGLEADRVVTMDGSSLTFDGTGTGDMVIAADGDISIGTATAAGDLNVVSDENQDAFHFTQENGTSGEKDVFTIEDEDDAIATQDESSVLKVVKSGNINGNANGFSLVELANTGTDPGDDMYWISGRKVDEGAPLWGVDITDNDYWSEGGIVLGVTGADGGTYSGGNFIVESDGDVGIGHIAPNGPLHIVESTGTGASATDGTVIIEHEDDGGSSSIVFPSSVNNGSDYGFIEYSDDDSGNGSSSENSLLTIGTQNDGPGSFQDDIAIMPSGNLGVGTTSPAARLDVDGGSVRFSDYGVGTYSDSTATADTDYILGADADGDVVELNIGKNAKWFYAPAVTIDASAIVMNEDIDLYQEYRDQFLMPSAKSVGAPDALPFYDRDELYYYITFHDDTVLTIDSITAGGVFTYDIIDVPFDNYTIVNVVFVIK